MALNLSRSSLKTGEPLDLVYGASQELERTPKENWREYILSNLVASTAVASTFVAGSALIAFAAGAALPISAVFAALIIAPLALTVVAPVLNRVISGTGYDRDPRSFVNRHIDLMNRSVKYTPVKEIPEDMSTEYFKRPSLGTILAAGVVGLVIGAISFAFPVAAAAPGIAVAAMFGTGFMSASLAGMYSAAVPTTLERLHFESKVREITTEYEAKDKPTYTDRIERAATGEIEDRRKQTKLATEAIEKESKEGGLKSKTIENILLQRGTGDKKSFVDRIMQEDIAQQANNR